jgi:hypothetical protein
MVHVIVDFGRVGVVVLAMSTSPFNLQWDDHAQYCLLRRLVRIRNFETISTSVLHYDVLLQSVLAE